MNGEAGRVSDFQDWLEPAPSSYQEEEILEYGDTAPPAALRKIYLLVCNVQQSYTPAIDR